MHVVVVPFNILTLPIVYLYWGLHEDTGEEVLNQYQIGKRACQLRLAIIIIILVY